MIVNILLFVLVFIWAGQYVITFAILATNANAMRAWEMGGHKFRHGIMDILGIAALIGVVVRFW